MGRFDVSLLKYLTSEQFRILIAVELGMRNHDLVPHRLVAVIANLRYGGAHKVLRELAKQRLVAFESWRSVQGYRLTNLGYDYLALRSLASRDSVTSVGNQIGVGKESDLYLALDANGDECVIKFHRLGRTSFKKVKEKRDYQRNGRKVNWIYLSRLSAVKEYAFMSALHKHRFPVPEPIDTSRHAVVMKVCPGYVLNQVEQLGEPERVFTELMNNLTRLASVGLIHGDFNEFNVMLSDDYQVSIIDFPQMVSTSHINAEALFNRDKNCILTFFKRRYNFEPKEELPDLSEIKKVNSLDEDVKASGFTADIEQECDEFLLDENEDVNRDREDKSEEESDPSEDSHSDSEDGQRDELRKSQRQSKKSPEQHLEEKAVKCEEEVDGVELEKELEENYSRCYPASGKAQELNEAVNRDLMARLRLDSEPVSVGEQSVGRRSLTSTSYVSTTIPPEVIKSRLQRQSAKQTKREQCRRAVRHGEASLKTKKKLDTKDDIKTSVSALWF